MFMRQQGVQGDGSPPAGVRGIPATSFSKCRRRRHKEIAEEREKKICLQHHYHAALCFVVLLWMT